MLNKLVFFYWSKYNLQKETCFNWGIGNINKKDVQWFFVKGALTYIKTISCTNHCFRCATSESLKGPGHDEDCYCWIITLSFCLLFSPVVTSQFFASISNDKCDNQLRMLSIFWQTITTLVTSIFFSWSANKIHCMNSNLLLKEFCIWSPYTKYLNSELLCSHH